MFLHNLFSFGAKKCPFSLREEVSINRLFSSLPGGRQETACLRPGWNWHLARQIVLPPVAVVSSGQSLHHSE
jgi:hypothetical protein